MIEEPEDEAFKALEARLQQTAQDDTDALRMRLVQAGYNPDELDMDNPYGVAPV